MNLRSVAASRQSAAIRQERSLRRLATTPPRMKDASWSHGAVRVSWRPFKSRAALWFFVFASVLSALAQTAIERLEPTRLFGHDYIRLADWAHIYNFRINRPSGSDVVQLTSKWSKLIFTIDSQKAKLNGVTVYLSIPVAAKGNQVYLTYLDLITVVQPVLIKPQAGNLSAIRRICLDPGHGGKDPGNQASRRLEKEYTLLLARELKSQLHEAGLNAVLTRDRDTFVGLPDRPAYAKRNGADLFVSLHFNAAQSGANKVKGVEVYCLTPAGASSTNARADETDSTSYAGNRFDPENMRLAYQIQNSLIGSLSAEDRGVKHARFAVLREAAMPAVLIEAGFMSHPQESRQIFDPGYRLKLAQAIAEGIVAYKERVGR
jgi:N-acetylmuramoyl-L-alanine amidase